MPIDESDLAYDFFSDLITKEAPVEEPPVEEAPVDAVVDTPAPVAEQVEEEAPAPIDNKSWMPEFKKDSDKYVYEKLLAGEDKEIYEILSKKYGHEGLSDEQKAMAYIASQNPELDQDELSFLAATEYGIGAEEAEEELLTDEQKLVLKKQSIDRKKLITKANNFFKEQATNIELPTLPADPDYVKYKEETVKQAELSAKNKEAYEKTLQIIETSAKSINEVKESIEIDIDGGKLPFDVSFKLDEPKQKELISYVKNYTPTEAEVKQFTDQIGKFDYKGYLQSQAIKVFPKEFMAAAIKQALAKDRENFIEKELKNSTLRNNDISETVDKPFDIVDAWPFGK